MGLRIVINSNLGPIRIYFANRTGYRFIASCTINPPEIERLQRIHEKPKNSKSNSWVRDWSIGMDIELTVPVVDSKVDDDEVVNDVVLLSSGRNVIFAPLSNNSTVRRGTRLAELGQRTGQIWQHGIIATFQPGVHSFTLSVMHCQIETLQV